MNFRRTASMGLTALACATIAHAQTTTGGVRGLVSARKGKPIAGATVLVRNLEGGLTRTATTASNGEYALPLLPVGPYELTVTAPGMRAMKDSKVHVGLGQNTVVNFALDTAEAAATVEVTAVGGTMDTREVNTIAAVDERLVQTIPLQGRDFTNLVSLSPGTVYDPDNNRVSVEGARGIQNNLTIDGASYQSNFFGEQRGSTRIPFAFGADTIRELQVITNAFDAQYGNAAGAIINAVSKSGTNEFSGTFLAQFRPSGTVAKIRPVPYDKAGTINTDQARTKNFSQQQFNINVGGPIIKDKLHFFVGVETYRYKEDFTPNFAISSSGGNSNVSPTFYFDTFLATFGKLVVADNGRTLAQESGYTYTNDRKNTVYFGRLDLTINENHRATLRVNAQDWKSENGTTSFTSTFAPTTGQSQQGLEKNSGLSWVLELNSIFGSNLVNEARIQRAIERRPRFANTTASPEFQVNSGFTAGQNNFLPNGLDEFTWQLIDNLTWSTNDWIVKGGVDLQLFDFKNTFFRYQNGSYQIGNYSLANKWAGGTLASGDNMTYVGSYSDYGGSISYKSQLLATYLQGQYQGFLDRRLTLNLGVRVTHEGQPDNPRPNTQFNGLDQANSTTSVDPRLGFTLDLHGDGRTLVRGGYGWFSTPNPSLTVSNTMNSNGNTTSTYFINNSAATNALFNTGALSYASRVTGGGTILTPLPSNLLASLASASRTGQVWDPNNKLTVAKRTALGVDHSYGNGWTLGIQGVYAQFENLQYFVNINLNQVGAPAGSYYNDGYALPGVNTFSTSNRPGKASIDGRMMDFTNFGNVFLSKNGGAGTYNAVILTASKRSDTGWGLTSNVTFSTARDNNSNERTTASATADSNVNDPSNPLATNAYSDNDRRLRVNFAGYSPLAWGIVGAVNMSFSSGRPYSAIASADINGDGGRNDYLPGTQRNQFRQPSSKAMDLRLTRDFQISKRYQIQTFIDIFNVFNWANQRTTITSGQPTSDFGYINLPDRNTREVQFGARFRF